MYKKRWNGTIDPLKRIDLIVRPEQFVPAPKPKAAYVIDTGTAKSHKFYTGVNMIGIATMHKSNSVPVFNAQAAIDLAQMRRS